MEIKEHDGLRFELTKNNKAKIEQSLRSVLDAVTADGRTFLDADKPKPTEEDFQQLLEMQMKTEVWLSVKHQVAVYRDDATEEWPAMIHLSIKRIDKKPLRDWREMQAIKNALVGPKHEGVELYPAEDRLVDGANQYHLWVLASDDVRFPFGFNEGRRVDFEGGGGATQRSAEGE